MRTLRSLLYKWRGLIAGCLLLYAFILYIPYGQQTGEIEIVPFRRDNGKIGLNTKEEIVEREERAEKHESSGIEERVKEEEEEKDVAGYEGVEKAADREKDGEEEKQEKKGGIENTRPYPIQKNGVSESMNKGAPIGGSKAEISISSKSNNTANTDGGKEKVGNGVFSYQFTPTKGESFEVEDVLTVKGTTFEERMKCKVDKKASPKKILGWNTGLGQENLGGCPEWNCVFSTNRLDMNSSDAILLMHEDPMFHRTSSEQYLIYFSQESPANSGFNPSIPDYFNMSFGFRHDTPAASPYGYTVKLGEKSRKKEPFINETIVNGKSKAAAWFVSHCSTNSRREHLVQEMQKSINVDIYGACGPLKCARGADCEKSLDTDYHFYITFENSICQDYITEKVWNQGYGRDILPIVLKRSLAAPYLPPNSFLAVDDYPTVDDLTAHMHHLMNNKSAYMEYFQWREEYKVVFLNGRHHDVLEKPWGICQICRLLWETPRPTHLIKDFRRWWYSSCERDGDLVDPILAKTRLKTPVRKH